MRHQGLGRVGAFVLLAGAVGVVGLGAARQEGGAAEENTADALKSRAECEAEVGNCSNCVFYARCRRDGDLPTGLFTLASKKAIINTQTAHVGAVAVIDSGLPAGHVAYVTAVDADGNITVEEGNWPAGTCGRRTGTRESLHILGFYM